MHHTHITHTSNAMAMNKIRYGVVTFTETPAPIDYVRMLQEMRLFTDPAYPLLPLKKQSHKLAAFLCNLEFWQKGVEWETYKALTNKMMVLRHSLDETYPDYALPQCAPLADVPVRRAVHLWYLQ